MVLGGGGVAVLVFVLLTVEMTLVLAVSFHRLKNKRLGGEANQQILMPPTAHSTPKKAYRLWYIGRLLSDVTMKSKAAERSSQLL